MINSSIWLVGIPDELSVMRRIDLKLLMRRAVRVEDRMAKGVLLEDEQKRYHILCDRIEYVAHLISAEKPVVTCELGADYFEFLLEARSKMADDTKAFRLMSNFCSVESIEKYLNGFVSLVEKFGMQNRESVQRKIEFYHNAIIHKWNVVELNQQKINGRSIEITEDPGDLKKSFLSLKVVDNIAAGGETVGPFVSLRNHVSTAVNLLRKGMNASVNFSDLRHDVIAETLHEFAYMAGKPIYMPVVYGDGSKAEPFPMFCLRNRSKEAAIELNGIKQLDVGMMSQRHPEMDIKMKVYWFRNQEISIGRSAAETDNAAYKKAKELFLKLRGEGKYKIGFYQTGFQPAVVAFYRALTEELIYLQGKPVVLQVTPYYYMAGAYRTGKTWY